MEMTRFWSQVSDAKKLSLADFKRSQPEAAKLLADLDVSSPLEFADATIPNIGPGGPATDDDDVALADNPGSDDDVLGPSASNQQALMAYAADIDELYVYYPEDGWQLWNY